MHAQTSPGRKQEKRNPIVKLSKEQPAPLSVSGTSVPVPSGQSWVTEDTQKFKWTKWRIALAVFTVLAILAALLVAFSHPSSKIHHPDVSRFTQGQFCCTTAGARSKFLHALQIFASKVLRPVCLSAFPWHSLDLSGASRLLLLLRELDRKATSRRPAGLREGKGAKGRACAGHS